MFCEYRLVDIADRGKVDIIGVLAERQDVIIRYPPATHKADTELTVTYDRKVLHEVDVLDA
jgi:hypothetical protein